MKRINFVDIHVISTLLIFFLKSLMYKSSHAIPRIYYPLYHIYSISLFLIGTLYLACQTHCAWRYICLKSEMLCILHLFIYHLCIFNTSLSSSICSNPNWQIHKSNRKNDYNLKFTFCRKLERNLLFRFELSSLVTVSKHSL